MEEVVLILDRKEYQSNEKEIIRNLHKIYSKVEVVYTTYENELIRTVRNWKFLGNLLQHIFYWMLSYKYASKVYKKAKGKKVICINPIVGIFLGIRNQKNRFELILCGFLFEPKRNQLYYKLRKKITYFSLNGTDKTVIYSAKEVSYYQKIFTDYNGFVFVKFGMDYFKNTSYSGILPTQFLFSGGSSNRDYATLIKGYECLSKKVDIPLVIATNPTLIAEKKVKGITVLSDVVVENFGTVMSNCKCLILSLKDSDISTGHMVMIQALAENVPIIVNKISAICDYVSEKEVLFYESGNAEDMSNKIQSFLNGKWESPDTTEFYLNNYTFNAMLNRIICEIE